MFFKITKEKAQLLDLFINTTNSESITFDFNFFLEIQLITNDLSQLTIIKIDPLFFEDYSYENSFLFSIPKIQFYKENMNLLILTLNNSEIILEYKYNKISHVKKMTSLALDAFDLDFIPKNTIKIDLNGLDCILNKIIKKNTKLKINFGENFSISEKFFEIKTKTEHIKSKIEFYIESDKFMKICNISKNFNESYLSISEDDNPINIVLKTPEITFSSFLSV